MFDAIAGQIAGPAIDRGIAAVASELGITSAQARDVVGIASAASKGNVAGVVDGLLGQVDLGFNTQGLGSAIAGLAMTGSPVGLVGFALDAMGIDIGSEISGALGLDGLGEALGDALGDIGEGLGDIGESIGDALGDIGESIGEAIGDIGEALGFDGDTDADATGSAESADDAGDSCGDAGESCDAGEGCDGADADGSDGADGCDGGGPGGPE